MLPKAQTFGKIEVTRGIIVTRFCFVGWINDGASWMGGVDCSILFVSEKHQPYNAD